MKIGGHPLQVLYGLIPRCVAVLCAHLVLKTIFYDYELTHQIHQYIQPVDIHSYGFPGSVCFFRLFLCGLDNPVLCIRGDRDAILLSFTLELVGAYTQHLCSYGRDMNTNHLCHRIDFLLKKLSVVMCYNDHCKLKVKFFVLDVFYLGNRLEDFRILFQYLKNNECPGRLQETSLIENHMNLEDIHSRFKGLLHYVDIILVKYYQLAVRTCGCFFCGFCGVIFHTFLLFGRF